MPTLGFLKKKRTKESSKDPTSPTSPTGDWNTPTTTVSSPKEAKSSTFTASSNSSQPQSSGPTSETTAKQDDPMSLVDQRPMNQGGQHQQQQYAAAPQSTLPSHQQAGPSINNLIHPAQTDGGAQPSHPVEHKPDGHDKSAIGTATTTHVTMGGTIPPDKPTARITKGKYQLNDFALQRTLGTGSFGRVHLVQSNHNNRFYAVKVLKKAQVVKMKQVEHTNDERRMLGMVKHPFLITLWGTFQDAKNLYMVMDFVEGGELFSLLRKSQVSDAEIYHLSLDESLALTPWQRFPNPVAKFYAAEVTLALEYLHSMHIIYRDLKPENLLLDRHGHLKITDFGFAKEVPDITWTLCGTPDYLAPEVVASKGYNKSVDWWSLGILIFEMLCGFTPFWDGGSPMKIYENILKGRVKYPPYIHPDAQDLLQQLITPDLTKRLGNLHGGSQDVKHHPWFAEVTWERLGKKDIDAPYVPPVRGGVGDASQFDKYPEETEEYGQGGDDPHGTLFRDF
ncbi:MAG: camp-dependent protein kinase catalytic subunit [Piccolia ochrophora]|nr:MAG: camp-dependent protein kinase catalytic subunit [Piccolia ochrophora]